MIGGIGRHGRTSRDTANLASHLLRDKGALVEIVNSIAPDLRSIMGDMELARDGSRADSAFLHMYLSPSRDMSDDELKRAAEIVLRHFGAEDHQAAFVIHEKQRTAGDGHRHVHVVVGRVGPEGQVLPSGFEIIRMETAVRMAEYELGEPPVLGRHHVSALRWLRNHGRDDVADRLEAAFGPDPVKPVSVASPGARRKTERSGLQLSAVREAVRDAWDATDSPGAFRAALASRGLSIAQGQKLGVVMVVSVGREVGSLDRILKADRRQLAAWMSRSTQIAAKASPVARRAAVSRSPGQTRLERQIAHGALARIDLDEIRIMSEEIGRKILRKAVPPAALASDRESLRSQIRAETAALSTKGATEKPVGSQDRGLVGYDALAETLKPRFR